MTIPALKIDRFTILLVVILIMCAAMLVISLRASFNAFSIAYDLNDPTAGADLIVNESKLEEALNYTFGQKTIVPLNIKDSPVPVASITATPRPSNTPLR